VHARIEFELAAAHGVLAKRHHGPSGDDVGETGDVLLRVDRAHAERMQFEDLTREVLVEAAPLPQPGDRGGPDRARVVEIDEHGRMGFDRQQHVAEAAEHVGADHFALVGAANLAHIALVRRHAEMVRPEPDQPFDKTDFGRERSVDARLGLGKIDLLRQTGTGRRPRRRWRRRAGLLFHFRRAAGAGRIGLLGGALGLPRCALCLLIGECRARGHAARQQIRVADAGGARAI
jgi:hypothetical protein